MGIFESTLNSLSRTFLSAEGTALTGSFVNLVIYEIYTFAGRAFLVVDMCVILVSEIADCSEYRVGSGLA